MIVIYHASCTDGFTAAWCAWLKYGEEAEYMSSQYGDEPPDVTGKDVLIVDFSYPREALLKMNEQAKSLLVLDHHKTAAEALSGLEFAVFDMTRSGAGLTWDTLHRCMRPTLVDYVEDRDLWKWEHSYSREVSAYIATVEQTFEEWDKLRADLAIVKFNSSVEKGAAILRAQDRIVMSQARKAGRAVVGGYVVPFLNCTVFQSEIIGEMAESSGSFACGWFQRADGMFVYSLRSRGDFDVSEVAKSYGGGGHKNAAGFVLNALIQTSKE